MSFAGNTIGKVVGGITGATQAAEGAQSAANAQVQAANSATELSRDIYNQQRADATPWRDAGVTALNQLVAGTADGGDFNRSFTMADYQADPGYAFRLQQGQNSLESSAAARGSQLSGATLKALTEYGQNQASEEYNNAYNRFNNDMTNRYNRLSGLAGAGQTANQEVSNAASNYGAQAANNITGAGNARASGYIAQGNTTTNSLNSLSNLAGGIGLTSLAFSDRRLKSNIKRIGTHPSGLPWYSYVIFGETSQGVMADEVLSVNPEAVIKHSNGFLMVNYGAL